MIYVLSLKIRLKVMEHKDTEALIKSAQNFIIKVVQFSSQEVGGLLVDRLDFWKFRNKLSMVIMAQSVCESNQNEIRQISPDILIPLLEESGKKENSKILKMFASLLFGHLHPQLYTRIHSSYTNVLAQMSIEDISICEALYAGINSGEFDYKTVGFEVEKVASLLNIHKDLVRLSFQNLWRLGVCYQGIEPTYLAEKDQIVFTDYGWHFLKACSIIK